MFDITLSTATPDLAVPNEEEIEANGGRSILQMVIPVAMGIPTPQGALPIQVGVVRCPIERDKAIEFGKTLIKEAEKLRPSSQIQVASDLGSVNEAAARLESLKTG